MSGTRADARKAREAPPVVSWPMVCALAGDASCSDADLGAALRLFLGGFRLEDGRLTHGSDTP